ncbi:DNA mismatch repair protein MutS [Thermodesulforhabdus norvegica]|uniref:DNA mismatch repair protein MutS n=1 Tax=Thermodesulforhabdus norvegica TaxID=39841 RepID=A0A1I4U4T8_9BACT|nr:DNA mismatch repair protein MutS [Thermodesulforhabdus norvegica]SFM83851.1 DNA mismatch repair protein MutS [Thermodesulforhabdus norvegica]
MGSTEKMTPMMKQYIEIKSQYPDALLLYRMGDFYELFMEDAVTASRILNIALTTRDKNSENPVPMCGVPHHAADTYISKLVAAGYKVAICEQVEDPQKSRGLVERTVTRVITPGLILEEHNLDAKLPNYLAAIAGTDGTWGLAWTDISTGEFRISEVNKIDELKEEISRISPREALIPQSLETAGYELVGQDSRVALEFLTDDYFDISEGEKELQKLFSVHSLEGFGIHKYSWAIGCAGAIVRYIRDNHLPLNHLRPPLPYHRSDYMILDETTIRNLELFYSQSFQGKKGSLFHVLDSTSTPMGGRTLQQWIRYPLTLKNQINRRLKAVEELFSDQEINDKLTSALKNISDLERILSRLTAGTATPRDLASLRKSLRCLPAVEDCLSKCRSALLTDINSQWDSLQDVADSIDDILLEDPAVNWSTGYVIKDGVDEELDRCRRLSRDTRSWLVEYEQKQRDITGIASLKVKYNRVFGYFIEVPRSQVQKVPDYYHRKQTLVNAERYFTDELKAFEVEALHAEERRVQLERMWFERLCESILQHKERIQKTAELIGIIDCIASFAEVSRVNNYVKPNINEDGLIDIKEGRHPILEKMLPPGTFIPNDVYLDMDSHQILVITGPNMAGKSTILRQIALIVLMAHLGCFVPARSARICTVDRIFTRIGAADDLARGRSTFMVEMQETAHILHNATPKSLVILDEIGRGTSTYDGVSIAWAVVEHLHNLYGKGVKTLCATHYHELTELADILERVRNFNVAVRERDQKIVFLHKLVEGGANKSYGIHVARLAGLPEAVVQRAGEKLQELENASSGYEIPKRVKVARRKREKHVGLQLPLFTSSNEWLKREILSLDLDRTTPLMALQILYALQRKLKIQESAES